MNRLLSVLALVAMLVKSPKLLGTKVDVLPAGYYASACQQPPGLGIDEWVEQLDLGSFERGGWDCSRRSAYVEWLLQNCGVNAWIAARRGSVDHAWVLVEVDGGLWQAFETSDGGYWVSPGRHRLAVEDYFVPDYRVEKVQDWLTVWPGETEWFLAEWGWWCPLGDGVVRRSSRGYWGCTGEVTGVQEEEGAALPRQVPRWYYASSCQQPEGVSLHDWLGTLPWYGEIDLSGGGWDCSQMSAYIEWLAENCGYNAVFTCRTGGVPHCWVTIEGDPYEATGNYWIDLRKADVAYYTPDVWFDDIQEAFEYTEGNQNLTGLGEWGWWVTYPELVTESRVAGVERWRWLERPALSPVTIGDG